MTQAEKQALRILWKERVRDFRASGMSAVSWCKEHQLKTHQLWYWIQQYEKPNQPKPSPAWIPIRIDESPQPIEDRLLLRLGEITLEVKPGFNRQLLADVVSVLSQPC